MACGGKDSVYLYQINVTRDCNLRCSHCYIHSDVKASSKTMNDSQIESIAKGISEHMIATGRKHAEIHFVGGEPTMLGKEFYDRNMPKFRTELGKHGFSFEIMMISNLISPDSLSISAHFDRVTTSYEIATRFVSPKGSPKPSLEKAWLSNVKLLYENGIDIGVTTAITKPVAEHGAGRLLDMFVENGIKQIHFGFFIPEGDGLVNIDAVMPSFSETSKFLIESAEWYLANRSIEGLFVNPFESMLSAVHDGEPLDDIVCPIISGSMDVHWDGNASTCLEAGGAENPDWDGNVFETGILSVSQSESFMKKVRNAQRPQKACMSCDEYPICRSGCGVLFKFYDPILDDECPGFKKFIEYVKHKHSEGVLPKYSGYAGKHKAIVFD